MKKFIIKLTIFIFPLLLYPAYLAYEILVVPIDSFTFRVWEALVVYQKNTILKGPFYPYKKLSKTEEGDTLRSPEFTVRKDVYWETDRFGYREYQNQENTPPDVVLIGDSFIAGTGLTQSDMLASVLEEKLKINVYSYAPGHITEFVKNEYFLKNPPKVVVLIPAQKIMFSSIVPLDREIPKDKYPTVLDSLPKDLKSNKKIINFAVMMDRLQKQNFKNYFLSKIRKIIQKPLLRISEVFAQEDTDYEIKVTVATDKSMVFNPQMREYFKEETEVNLNENANVLLSYKDFFEKKGIKFIFAPVPNKENAYYKIVPGGKKVQYFDRLINLAKEKGVEAINIATSYDEFIKNYPDKLLYHRDDSHWNRQGVEIVSDLLGAIVSTKLQ